jgi:hypothetical protein
MNIDGDMSRLGRPFRANFSAAYQFLVSATFSQMLDVLILVAAFTPAAYVSVRFLFGEHAKAQRLVASPVLLSWLLYFCGASVVLHLLKLPAIIKIVAFLIACIPFLLLVASMRNHYHSHL